MKLGVTARDKITGFEGVVTGMAYYLTGCHQVLLQPAMSEGKWVESHWFDLQRLEVTNGEVVVLDNAETPGFDREAPRR